jgi:hypothetical protein
MFRHNLTIFLRGTVNQSPDNRGSTLLRSINLVKPAGHVMHHQFNIQELYTLPTLYVFCVNLRTVTCATYIINWLVFITELQSVYCAVQTRSLTHCGPVTRILVICVFAS